MIESLYWKEELARIAKSIRPLPNPARWSERALCIIERDLMIGFFIVRRLIELHKVSSKTRDHRMVVFSYPVRGEHVNLQNHCDLGRVYRLEKYRQESKKPLYISNQFIHAYTSFVARDESRNWSDVFIVSDFDRNKCMWRVPIAQIRTLFCIAAEDYPEWVRRIRDDVTGDFKVSTD